MRILLVSGLAFLFGVPSLANALVIDDFTTNTPSTTTTVFTDGTMLGGERDVVITGGGGAPSPTFVATGGVATFTSNGPNNGGNVVAQIAYDGEDNNSAYTFGLTGANLTAGGADRIVVAVTAVNGPLTLMLRVMQSAGAYGTLIITNISTPGVYEFPYASFSADVGAVDFADAKTIVLYVQNLDDLGVGTPNPRSISIDYIRTEVGPLIFRHGFETP